MNWFGTTPLSSLLQKERRLLDEVFGQGTYRIEGAGNDVAVVRSSAMKCKFAFESRRDRSLSNRVTIYRDNWEWEDDSILWRRFLDEDAHGFARDRDGIVNISVEEQLTAELKHLIQMREQLFSSSQRVRDAANFLKGYSAAYNDYCQGKMARSD